MSQTHRTMCHISSRPVRMWDCCLQASRVSLRKFETITVKYRYLLRPTSIHTPLNHTRNLSYRLACMRVYEHKIFNNFFLQHKVRLMFANGVYVLCSICSILCGSLRVCYIFSVTFYDLLSFKRYKAAYTQKIDLFYGKRNLL